MSTEQYANYWLLPHTTSTEAENEPPEDMSEEAFTQSVLMSTGLLERRWTTLQSQPNSP